LDSCVTAALARQTHDVALLHVAYGQRTEQRELRAFHEIADFWQVTDRLVAHFDHFRQIGGSALTDGRIAVPERPSAGREIPPTYVPFRNANLLASAVSWAEALGARAVFIGAVHEDSSGYPDCRPEFYEAFQQAINRGTRPQAQIALATPVIGMRKAEIVRQGIALGAPLHLTWSCYQNDELACSKCESCMLRLRAFAEAGERDPAPYRLP
jgi:7-cyano-7-deazaguanine synthase